MLTTSIIDEHLSKARRICEDTKATKQTCKGGCNNSLLQRAPEPVRTITKARKELNAPKRPTILSSEDLGVMAMDTALSNPMVTLVCFSPIC